MNRVLSRPIRLSAGLLLLLFVLAAGCSQDQTTQTETSPEPAMRVAVVDETRIFNESNAGLEGVKMLNELNQSLREELAAMQDAAQGNGTEEDVANFRAAVQRYQEIMNNQQRALYDAVQEEYVAVLAEFRRANDIDVVFGQENALSYNPDVDITEEVIAALNSASVELPAIDPTEYSLAGTPAAEETVPAVTEESPEAAAEAPEAAEEAPADENATQPEAAEESAAQNASGGNATE